MTSLAPVPSTWLDNVQRHLSRTQADINDDVAFVCAGGETVQWNGLAYLAVLSSLFSPCPPCSAPFCPRTRVTVVVPDRPADTVRSAIRFLSTGKVEGGLAETVAVWGFLKELGVRKS